MKRIIRRSAWLAFCLVFLAAVCPAQVSLTILHTNDTHGHLLPFSYPSNLVPRGSDIVELKVRQNIGGIARRATLARNIQAVNQKQGGFTWLIDAGDFTEGTPFSTEYKGKADVEAMNAAGYTFATIGNHELNNPLTTLRDFLALAKFPILCANLTNNSTGKPLVTPSVITKVGPIKIAVFGITTPSARGYQAAKEGLTIGDEIETARRMTQALSREANFVFLISHAGEDVDEEIAGKVPGIDVIIGGHSHTRMPLGTAVPRDDALKARSVNDTMIVQDWENGAELGRLDILFDKDEHGVWRIARHRERLIEVTPDIPEDSKVAEVVARYWKPIAARYGEVIGKAEADVVEDGLVNYNFVADAVRETFGTEIDLENTGGIRAPIIKGEITLANLIEVDPFDNTVVTFKITGRKLKQVLQISKPGVSGIRYRIEGKKLTEVTVGGKPVEDDREYTACSNSYFAGTGLKGIKVEDTGKVRRNVIMDYIRKKGTIRPLNDGRRIIID